MSLSPPPVHPFPRVPPTLVAALERIFPDRAPDSALSNDEIRERIGEARVLRFLQRQLARQARASVLSRPQDAARSAPAVTSSAALSASTPTSSPDSPQGDA